MKNEPWRHRSARCNRRRYCALGFPAPQRICILLAMPPWMQLYARRGASVGWESYFL